MVKVGGTKEDRTPDLSVDSGTRYHFAMIPNLICLESLVAQTGIEPVFSTLRVWWLRLFAYCAKNFGMWEVYAVRQKVRNVDE